jgi:release factor glutamine methyltransferase
VGSGTGYVVTSAALLANDASTSCRCFATDVNPDAVAATRATANAHGVGDAVEAMRCDLLGPLRESLAGKIDLLLFNPPYVLTPSEEVRDEDKTTRRELASPHVGSVRRPETTHEPHRPFTLTLTLNILTLVRPQVTRGGIAAAWAGGVDGREVLDRLLPDVASALSPGGVFLLLLLEQNKPKEVAAILEADGLECEMAATCSADEERLHVMRAVKPPR